VTDFRSSIGDAGDRVGAIDFLKAQQEIFMKLDLRVDETHKRIVTVRIPWNTLQVFFAEHVAREARMPMPHLPGLVNRTNSDVTAKIEYHEETGGSVGAGYRTGFSISVTLMQDMCEKPLAADEAPAPV